MFAVIVQACGATVALTDTTYQHQKKLVGIRDAFQKWSLSRRQLANAPTWPESLTWITTDNKTAPKIMSDIFSPVKNDDEAYRAQIAFLQFTSGSTSDPKGVMITHGNLAHNLRCITNELKATDDTIVVSWLPQYHDMGLIGSVLGCLYCGGTGYYMSPLSFLQRPMLWIEAISQWKATHLQAPNFAYKLTARKFQENLSKYKGDPLIDLSSVRHAINAAEPVDMESISTFYQTFGPFGFQKVIYPTYGLAEHTVFVCSGGTQVLRVNKEKLETHGLVVITNDKSNENVSTMVGCGYPSNQGIDVRIVKDEAPEKESGPNATAVDDDVVGEVWVNSPSKAAGYYGKPLESSEDFHACLQRPNTDPNSNEVEGYLRTGDLGFLHNGELFICGRLKDLIIVGGRNYYPQDIESTAESLSDLVRLGCSAAFTIDPTRKDGEEVALVMELKEVPSHNDVARICDPLANQIRSLINQDHSIGVYSIVFLKPRTIPKTSSGKIARAWCRKAYIAGNLNKLYQKTFKAETSTLEVEHVHDNKGQQPNKTNGNHSTKDATSIRAMSKDAILAMLITDIARVGNINANSIDKKASLIHMLDSLSITQFKGMLENNYAVKLSDEYLFRETTTAMKLVDVVKLGYAPDDAEGTNTADMAAASTTPLPGRAKGLAGALGCPPGVVCVIM
jgi:acyl-CoA synthetase (AMP-forming)/AMP-acid ligase II